MKRLGIVLALVLFATSLVSCAGGQASPAPQPEPSAPPSAPVKERVIAYVPQTSFGDESSTAYFKGVESGLRQFGYRMVVDDPDFDAAKQVNIIENFVAQKVDGIITEPVDSSLIASAIEKANQAGIPVIPIINTANGGETLLTVTSNAMDEGRLAGEKVIRELEKKYGEPKGLVLEISGPLGSELVQRRSDGFKGVMDKHPNITVLQRPCDWEIPKAENTVMDVLTANPELDAIYTHSDFYGDAVESALVSKGRLAKVGEEGHIIWTSIDGAPNAFDRIRKGIQDSTSNAACDTIGFLAAKYMHEYTSEGIVLKIGDTVVEEGTVWSPGKVVEGKSGPVLMLASFLVDGSTVENKGLWGNIKY